MNMIPFVNRPAPEAWKPEMTAGIEVVFDPSNLSSMFQTNDLSIPAQPGSPVGLIFGNPVSGKKTLVQEYADTGTFTAAGTTPPVTNPNAVHKGLPCRSATFRAGMDPNYGGARAAFPAFNADGFLIGECEVAVSRPLVGDERVTLYLANGSTIMTLPFTKANTATDDWVKVSGPGGHRSGNTLNMLITFYHGATTQVVQSDVTFYIRQVKVRKVEGVVGLQIPAANRPMLSRQPKTGRRNSLQHTEDLTNSDWLTSNSPDTVIGDIVEGLTNVTFTAASTDRRFPRWQRHPTDTLSPGDIRYLKGTFKPSTGITTIAVGVYVTIGIFGLCTFNTATGVWTPYSVSTIGAFEGVRAIEMPDGAWEIVVKYTAGANPSAAVLVHFGTGNGSALRLASPAGSCRIGRVQMSISDNPYQKVVGPFDVTEAGVPEVWSLYGEGLTSFISTVENLTFNANSAAFAVAMQSDVKADGDNNARKVFAATTVETANVNVFGLQLRSNVSIGGNSHNVGFRQNTGSSSQANLSGILDKTKPFALIGTTDATNVKAYLNDVLVASSPTPAVGAVTAPIQIGSTLQPWNFYGGMFFTRVPEAPERAAINKLE